MGPWRNERPSIFMNEYPKWLYHSKHEPVIVDTPVEESKFAKSGYVTHPDKLDAPVPHKPTAK